MRIWILLQAYLWEFRRNQTLLIMPALMLVLAGVYAVMANSSKEMTSYFIAATFILSGFMCGMQLTSLALAEEKEKRTLEALFLTPVRPIEVILSRVLMASLITTAVWIGELAIFRYTPARPLVLAPVLLLTLLFVTAIGVTVGLVAPDQKAAGVVGAPIMVSILLLAVMPWQQVLPVLWEIQVWLPTRPLTELIMTGVAGVPGPTLRNFLVLLLYTTVTLVICARQIRRAATAK